MKPISTFLTILLLAPSAAWPAAELDVTSPRDFQVVQRTTPTKGAFRLVGRLADDAPPDALVETRFVGSQPKPEPAWQRLNARVSGRAISGLLEAPAGGWWKLEVRVSHEGKEFARGSVEHV